MTTEDEKYENMKKNILPGTEKMVRRDFFLAAGKLVIPTLGFLGLSLSGLTRKVAAGCSDSCTGGCSDSCKGCVSCTGSCAGECVSTCRDICANSCTVGCSGTSN